MKVLHSSDENGLCYIDTQNLDGEANLKQREVPRGLFAKGEDSSQFSPAEFREPLVCYSSSSSPALSESSKKTLVLAGCMILHPGSFWPRKNICNLARTSIFEGLHNLT